jgi:hypothetical protein
VFIGVPVELGECLSHHVDLGLAVRANGFFIRSARMQINTKFSASELSALEIPLPPYPLQRQFAARVQEIRALEAR